VTLKFLLKTCLIFLSLALFAGCGDFEWLPDTNINTTTNIAPVANAGTAQSVTVGALVQLDGSGSSDANNNPLTYSWTFTSKPTGSTAALASSTAVNPTFTADIAGVYVVSLVVNDGAVSSSASSVTVTAAAATGNVPPVANAGVAQSVIVGDLVQLDGSGSSDANGDPLNYSWAIVSKPATSAAALSNPTAVNPTFTADVSGGYNLTLIVLDGQTSSPAATVTVSAFNSPPTANAGLDQTVTEGTIVQLDGSASSGANLRYNWSRQSASCGILSNATAVNPTLTGSVTGTCVMELQVFDRIVGSTPDTVVITVTPSNTGSITVTW